MPVNDEDRARVVKLAETGLARNEVARQTGVSTASVSRIAKAAGIDGAWSRDQTKKATEAKVIDAKARRARLSQDLLDDIEHVRAVLRSIDKPQGLMHSARAVSDLVGSHGQLVALDAGTEEDDLEHSKSLLGQLFDATQAWAAGQATTEKGQHP